MQRSIASCCAFSNVQLGIYEKDEWDLLHVDKPESSDKKYANVLI